MNTTQFLVPLIVVNAVSAAFVYWRGTVTGTPRWIAFYTALILGPLALPLLIGMPESPASDRTPEHGA